MRGLTNGATNFNGFISDKQKQTLQRLASESNNTGILVLKPDKNSMSVDPDKGTLVSVNFDVGPDFMKKLSALRTADKNGKRSN